MSTDDESAAGTTRITRKGQVTIPKEVREQFGLEEGDTLRWEADEDGIDVLEAPSITVSKTVYTVVRKSTIADTSVETTPNAVLRGLVTDGPVTVVPADEQDLAVFGSLIEHHTLHDALLIASHRVRGTESIVTNDTEFDGEPTVWA